MTDVASRQLAVACIAESAKRRQLLSHNQRSSAVAVVGESFYIGEEGWDGLAIISPDALFLLRVRRNNSPVPKSSDQNLAILPPPLPEVPVSELPAAVTGDPAWPRIEDPKAELVILLRDRTTSVRPVAFTNDILFESRSPLVRVCCTAVGADVSAERIKRAGWMTAEILRNESVPALKPFNWGPLLMGGGAVLLLAITLLVINSDTISSSMSMLICIPVLAFAGFAAYRYLAPRDTDALDASAKK